jgi:hypothetical protein
MNWHGSCIIDKLGGQPMEKLKGLKNRSDSELIAKEGA